jgi:hypothetical protein
MTLAIPTIHPNGTSRDELLAQVCEAFLAISEARRKLAQAAPNDRDYYPQGNGAHSHALTEHEARIADLNRIAKELEQMGEAIHNGGFDSNAHLHKHDLHGRHNGNICRHARQNERPSLR